MHDLGKWIAVFDRHEGAGTWLAAIGTFAAVVVSLGLAGLSVVRERADKRERSRERVSLVTSRFRVHECLQLAIVFRAPGWESGWEARVKVRGPKNAYLVEAVRRPREQGDRRWVEVGIGHPDQMKSISIPLDWRFGDPDDALRGSVFVTNGPGDKWAIGEADVEIAIFRVGGKRPATTVKAHVTPVGEHPREARLAGKPI